MVVDKPVVPVAKGTSIEQVDVALVRLVAAAVDMSAAVEVAVDTAATDHMAAQIVSTHETLVA